MNNPLISIIIPVYNVKKYLLKCIQSIVIQTYKNIEILLVDDGSTDGSGELCDSIQSLDTRIKVIHKENGGLSSARNAGIDFASGEYFSFVDSDDWICEDMIEKLYQAIIHFSTKLAICGRNDVNEDTDEVVGGLCPVQYERLSSEEIVGNILTWKGMDSSACDKLFDKQLFENLRFPEGMISEDVAVMYRIILQTDYVATVPSRLYNYNHRNNSITTSSFNEKKLHIVSHTQGILEYVKMYYPQLIEKAIYFRCASLIYAYDILVQNKMYNLKPYSKMIRNYLKEIKLYSTIYLKYDSNKSFLHKFRFWSMKFPSFYFMICRIYLRNKQ